MESINNIKRGALVRVQTSYTSLLPAEKKVASFVMKHRGIIPNFSIQNLAIKTNTSPASITRFCKSIGYSGYKEFIRAVKEDISLGNNQVHEKVEASDDTAKIIKKICLSNSQSCIDTAQILGINDIDNAVNMILKAKRVLIFGDGPIAAVAIDLYHKLLRLGLSCLYIQDRRLQNIQSRVTSSEDVVIGLSFSGASRGTINSIKFAKENKSKSIVITNSIGSPITQFADISLYAAYSVNSMITGTIDSRIAQFCVVDSLFLVMINKNRKHIMEGLEKTNDAILDDW